MPSHPTPIRVTPETGLPRFLDDAATRYWNAHRHPFVWGRRNRRRAARPAGIAALPAGA